MSTSFVGYMQLLPLPNLQPLPLGAKNDKLDALIVGTLDSKSSKWRSKSNTINPETLMHIIQISDPAWFYVSAVLANTEATSFC